MRRLNLLLFAVLVVFAGSAYAGEVDDCLSSAGVYCSVDATMTVSICPAGDFEFIRQGCGGEDDYIWIEVLDALGEGIEGIPWTDFYMNACDPAQALCLCAQPIAADEVTDANGRTTMSGRFAGGGCILTGGMWVAVQGKPLYEQPGCIDLLCLDIMITSPDVNGSCQVSLADFSPFVSTYNRCTGNLDYNPCCDYTDDDCVSLSDFAFFAEHYQHVCQ
jgi:hypothetical protein